MKQGNNESTIYLDLYSIYTEFSLACLWMQVQLLLRNGESRCGATSSTLCMFLGNFCSFGFLTTSQTHPI